MEMFTKEKMYAIDERRVQPVALKVQKDTETAQIEARVLESVRHVNVIDMIDVIEYTSKGRIIYERRGHLNVNELGQSHMLPSYFTSLVSLHTPTRGVSLQFPHTGQKKRETPRTKMMVGIMHNTH